MTSSRIHGAANALMRYAIIVGMCAASGTASVHAQTPKPPEPFLYRVPKYVIAIGVETYRPAFPNVDNAINDASRFAEVLHPLGFDRIFIPDADKTQILDALDNIQNRELRKAEGDGAVPFVVFFFAGHGFSAGYKNFIVPKGIQTREGLLEGSIEISQVVRRLAGDWPLAIILDACREQPFDATSVLSAGFSAPLDPGETIFGFGASWLKPAWSSVNKGDQNSPFTTALLHQLPRNSVEIAVAFRLVTGEVLDLTRTLKPKQEPELISHLRGQVYFLLPPNFTWEMKQLLDKETEGIDTTRLTSDNRDALLKYRANNPMSPYNAWISSMVRSLP